MISGRSRLLCLIGDPVSHSTSLGIHNTGFELLGLDYVFMCFRSGTEELGDTVKALRRLNARGFSCTMPVKSDVCNYMDELSPAAELMHAVNCAVFEDDGRLVGHNTDGAGFFAAAGQHGCDITERTIAVLGCGGAGSAIIVQAALEGAKEITIFTRPGKSSNRADELSEKLMGMTGCTVRNCDITDNKRLKETLESCYMLVNATPVGMAPDTESTLIPDKSWFRKDLIVADAIYNPSETRLVREAKEAGCLAFGGNGMQMCQAAEAFRIWTGCDMPVGGIIKRLSGGAGK